MRKFKAELARQYEAHLPICRRAGAQDHQVQSTDHPASQTVLPQYAVFTSGQQQFISPVLLLSDASGTVPPSTPVQLVTVAPSYPNFTASLDVNLANSSASVKQVSNDIASSESGLSNGDAVLDCNNKVLNGVGESVSDPCDGVSEALLAAVDAQTQNHNAAAADNQNSADGVSSVPASPITKPVYNTRRRRSMPSIPRTPEPALKALKRSSTRHMSSDETHMKRAAGESDNLPLFLSSMTDD